MIGYLRGKVIFLSPDSCILDVAGVGYRLFLTREARAKLHIDAEASFFIYTSVREDAIQLFAFPTHEEYEVFLKLLAVSGIGPKVAMGIVSAISTSSLIQAVQQKNAAMLTKLPGIGKKSAERIILELKDKFPKEISDLPAQEEAVLTPSDTLTETDEALRSLGYTPAEIASAFTKIKQTDDAATMLKAALRVLGNG